MSFLYRAARRLSEAIGPQSRLIQLGRPLAERLVQWSAGRRGIAWTINGTPCRINPSFRAQLARNYDAHLAAYLRDKVKTGHTCFDVGANIGAWVIQFASWVGDGGRVVAFEPNPHARAVLEEHVQLNGVDERTRVVPAAVGAEAGEVRFFTAGVDGMARIGEANPLLAGRASPITVSVTTLDRWCREHAVAPDWLLIDVEGFEGHVLLGAADLIRARGQALGILVEMHPGLWPASGTSRDEVAARITAVGRRPVALTGQTDPLAEYGHVVLEPT